MNEYDFLSLETESCRPYYSDLVEYTNTDVMLIENLMRKQNGLKEMASRQLADTYRKRAEELELKALQIEAFGSDEDYPEETVIFFRRNFGSRQIYKPSSYVFVAVKCGNGFWYVTGNCQRTRYTWSQLVEEHLIKAQEEDADRIWIAKKWESLG